MAWQYDPTSRQFYNADTNQWSVGQMANPGGSPSVWGVGNGYTGEIPLIGDTQATDSGMSPADLYAQFGGQAGYAGPGMYSNVGGTLTRMGSSDPNDVGGLTGKLYVNPTAGQKWATKHYENKDEGLLQQFFNPELMKAAGVAGLALGAGNFLSGLGGAAGGGAVSDPFAGGFTGDIGFDAAASGGLASPAAGAAAGGMNMPGGVQQLIQQLQQMPGGSQLASALVQQLMGGGGSGPGGSPSGTGINLGSLLPLLGIGSGLKTMFGTSPAVDPNMVKALWQAGQNTYNTSLDPQAALYGRTAQQVQDQARQANAATGVGMGPYAAGVEDQAMRNFNIDWQNAQLGRQVQGTDAFARAGGVGAQAGVAGAAQQFAQNQTGLNNLTTGAGQLFGAPSAGGTGSGASAANPFGNWLNSAFTSLFPGTGGGGTTGGFDPNSSYNSAGTFQPYYTGTDISGGAAYG